MVRLQFQWMPQKNGDPLRKINIDIDSHDCQRMLDDLTTHHESYGLLLPDKILTSRSKTQ